MKCAKCKKDATCGSTLTNGQKSYRFCRLCADILETFPIPLNVVDIFLQKDKEMNHITKNIFEARKRRVLGQSPWSH